MKGIVVSCLRRCSSHLTVKGCKNLSNTSLPAESNNVCEGGNRFIHKGLRRMAVNAILSRKKYKAVEPPYNWRSHHL
ncbi:MAG: hypothetical protein LUC18_05510 [Porphyromonadaceae bacterium]|nr:hypothetical protein [Porphyromonadaceae bacterium]